MNDHFGKFNVTLLFSISTMWSPLMVWKVIGLFSLYSVTKVYAVAIVACPHSGASVVGVNHRRLYSLGPLICFIIEFFF